VKISESPHEISDDSIANAAVNAMAPRGVFGIDASHDVTRATGGELATTKPPMITSAICIVKLTSDQKPLLNSFVSFTAGTPIDRPPMKTMRMAPRAKTKASGNHRSQKSAMRDPARASSMSGILLAHFDRRGCDGFCESDDGTADALVRQACGVESCAARARPADEGVRHSDEKRALTMFGRTRWAIAEGYIPAWSHGKEPEFTSHETACILNANDQDAHVEILIYYSDREPAGPYRLTVPARRTKHLRFNDLTDPEPIPHGTDYASVIRSDVPIVVQHTRLDSRQSENALLTTIAFSE